VRIDRQIEVNYVNFQQKAMEEKKRKKLAETANVHIDDEEEQAADFVEDIGDEVVFGTQKPRLGDMLRILAGNAQRVRI
jgi:hypothetical protein